MSQAILLASRTATLSGSATAITEPSIRSVCTAGPVRLGSDSAGNPSPLLGGLQDASRGVMHEVVFVLFGRYPNAIRSN